MIGALHNATDLIHDVSRSYYNEVFIDRVAMEIQNAYEVNHITKQVYIEIEKVLRHVKGILIKEKQNFLIIHADLSRSNIIYNNGNLSPIDFSLSGYGIPEMEIGDILCSLNKMEYAPSLIAGYESMGTRKINTSYINIFTSLSIIFYIVIHHNKLYQDEKFISSLDRWRQTFFIPVNNQCENN